MANTTTENGTFTKIEKLITSSRFNEAFMLLKAHLNPYPTLSHTLQKLKDTENTYKYLLDYIASGHQEPSQKEVLDQIRSSLYHANDLLLRETRLTDSSDLYSSTRRLDVLRNITYKTRLDNFIIAYQEDQETKPSLISPKQANMLDELFNYVWTINGAPSSEYDEIYESIEDNTLPEYLKIQIISALLLGSFSYFDPNAFELLLNIYENSEEINLKAKAFTGVVLLALLYPRRLAGNLRLRSRLMLMAGDDDLKRLIEEVLISILRTYDTQRIDNKMRNEVIPELMKIKPEIMDKIRDLSTEAENILDDVNPKWEELLENSVVGDKLHEINDMQMEGADVMVTAFSNLKTFPFFNNVSHWFLPFNPKRFEFASLQLEDMKETTERFTAVMCDSDLHSFLLSLGAMPEDNRSLMLKNMEAQLKEAKEAMENSIGETYNQKMMTVVRHSLQDIYRFFKFFKRKNDFKDPFGAPFIAYNFQPIIPVFDISNDMIRLMAEFYFKYGYYQEAIGFFELIDASDPQINNWEKIGYGYDLLKNFSEAIKWYEKAELVDPENIWLIKRLAYSYKNIGNFDKALEYFRKALQQEPENYHLLLISGQILLELGKTEEALLQFYHAQYLKPERLGPLRTIAWAELLNGNYEKARENYEKILQSPKFETIDILNAGHTEMAAHNFPGALAMYRKFIENSENKDITSLLLAFRDDSETFKKLDIKTMDLRLIVDKLRYEL